MDDLTPMEPAEVLEEKPESAQTQACCFETGVTRYKKKRCVPVLPLCILLLLAAAVAVALLLFDFRITRTDGEWSLHVTRRSASGKQKSPLDPLLPSDADNTAPTANGGIFQNTTDSAASLHITRRNSNDSMSLQEIYKKVNPSVVLVTTADGGYCSGVIMSEDGYIITSYRTVASSGTITVTLSDEEEYTAYSVGGDAATDITVIKIDASGLRAAEFGSTSGVQVGDDAFAIGNPLGTQLTGTMTDGIISAVNRDIRVNTVTLSLLQTTAALNEGNYGGPLINAQGQVIGINIAKYSTGYASSAVEGIGFALPTETVKSVVDELVANGYVSGRLSYGFLVEDVPELQRYYYGFPSYAVVSSISTDSNAYQAGLRPGDAIVAVGETKVESAADFSAAISAYTVGDSVSLTFYQDGEYYICSFPLSEQGKT